MKIDGLSTIARVRASLKEYFGGADVWVEIRKYHPYAAAQIREESMKGMKFESFEAGQGKKSAKVSAIPVAEGMADREMAVRNLKLKHGVSAHNVQTDGQTCAWDKPLWDAMDEANPAILQYVTAQIDAQNTGPVGDDVEVDPT